ncbi:MAG: anaerobic ribonucleoside-triphosphate reductase activating protein [Candidatus Aureabacteria bacterium]|nr:anaerobic ribonucleoside-triphosphate reductase activating protein [Candidatus Auribacterota bacterium]
MQISKSQSLPEIKGFIKNTLIEWDGLLSSEVFLPNCNFRCPFCHSYKLFQSPGEIPSVKWEEVLSYMAEKKQWVDGLVICGGEPLMDKNIIPCLRMLKSEGVKVKIDTNGYFPHVLGEILEEKLAAYVAMDIKAPLNNADYGAAAGLENIDVSRIKDSVGIIMASSPDYEFRTTACPLFVNGKNIEEIALSIKDAKKYSIQQFNPENCFSARLRSVKPYPKEYIEDMRRTAGKYVRHCAIKGI